jgi:hypothetical protein
VSKEVIEKIADLMIAAFGLIAALAWNSAIEALVGRFVEPGSGPIALIIYAIIITLIAVLATVWIARVAKRLSA